MTQSRWPTLLVASCTLTLAATTAGAASLADSVKSAVGSASDGGGLTGLGMPGMDSVGAGNAAGVLQYCVKNNSLGGGAAGVKDRLMGKLGGQGKAEQDTGYRDGAAGLLEGGDGKQFDLSGGGLKKKVTEKICDQVLEHGQSLL